MSPEQIRAAQSPVAGWESESRAFRPGVDADAGPRWADFHDPLEAIQERAAGLRARAARNTRAGREDLAQGYGSRFDPDEREALRTLGLSDEVDLATLRRRYAELVRRFHPDRNGGDRRQEAKLAQVVEAYQLLRRSAALSG